MRMSTRGRFGLRALLHLAVCEPGRPVSVAALAETMEVSPDYLMQLFVRLRRAGLVKSVRGPRGGFKLARQPSKVSVGDIVRAVEGPIAVTDCVDHREAIGSRRRRRAIKNCANGANCLSRLVWEKLSIEITRILDATSLAEVIAEARRQRILPENNPPSP